MSIINSRHKTGDYNSTVRNNQFPNGPSLDDTVHSKAPPLPTPDNRTIINKRKNSAPVKNADEMYNYVLL